MTPPPKLTGAPPGAETLTSFEPIVKLPTPTAPGPLLVMLSPEAMLPLRVPPRTVAVLPDTTMAVLVLLMRMLPPSVTPLVPLSETVMPAAVVVDAV